MQNIINYHLRKYPKMTTQDIVKLLYQSYFGPGHFIKDLDYAISYYSIELKNSSPNKFDNLYEHIGNNHIRMNIHQYHQFLNNKDLINMFYESSLFNYDKDALMKQFKYYLSGIPNDSFLDTYFYTNVHHSITYNEIYNPHYRVINTNFLTLDMRKIQLQNYLDNINEFCIIALEGKCASGKTTITKDLNNVSIIDVDEFFLRKELKTKERLAEIGGNIDYDLYEECLKKIKPNSTITYTIFDCSTQSYKEKTIDIKDKVLLVGVYSYHQKVRKYINKLIYLLVNKEDQLERIMKRELRDRFINEWIPLEETYYSSFDFISSCDLII